VEITEVRIKLGGQPGERLQGFCSITFDNSFIVRDLKIIAGAHRPFVAMPSRKLTAHCPCCGWKNHLLAGHCNNCGNRITEDRNLKEEVGRVKLYADIAHPINTACREIIQERVFREFQLELDRSKLPGYRSTYDDFDDSIEIEISRSVMEQRKDSRDRHDDAARIDSAEDAPCRPHRSRLRHDGKTPPSDLKQAQFGAGILDQIV
jgi:stage V sporulation protein G